jgi:hypothetical protein
MSVSKRLTLVLFALSVLAFAIALVLRLGRASDGSVDGTARATSTEVTATTAAVATASPSASPPAHATPRATSTRNRTPWFLFLPTIGEARRSPTPTLTTTVSATNTPLPAPTPTPMIPWPEALESPGNSKLGLHVQWNNSPEIMEFIRRMKPAVIKAIDDLGFVAEAKEASPQTVFVARITHDQPTDGDPEAMARAFVAENLPTYLAHPAVDYWEGYNEPDVQGRMDWYARFEAERVRAMAENGLKAAIGSFSTGVPEFEEFQAFLPAVRAAKEHGGILALHEYDAPTLSRSVGAALPGRPSHPDRGVLALRYRWWYADILAPAGLIIPLVITEAGVDGLVGNRPGPAEANGWRDFVPYYREQYPGVDPLYLYLDQLEWYDRQVQQDGYVIGWALFTAGAMGDRWVSYDVTDYLRYIAKEILVPQAE